MGNITSWLLSAVLVYKYVGIFVITFFGALALPLPSGTVVMAAAGFATQGYFNIVGVILTGIAGNMAGDSAGYWLVRRYGLPAVRKMGLKRLADPENLSKIERQLDRHPMLTVFSSRFFTAVAPSVNAVAGFVRLSYKRFLIFEALGEITEVTFFGMAGYYFGTNWQYFSRFSGKFWILFISSLVLSYGIYRKIFMAKTKKIEY